MRCHCLLEENGNLSGRRGHFAGVCSGQEWLQYANLVHQLRTTAQFGTASVAATVSESTETRSEAEAPVTSPINLLLFYVFNDVMDD